MPEKTKPQEKDERISAEDVSEEQDETCLDEVQNKKSYYYDDAYGYEIYNPDEDEEDKS